MATDPASALFELIDSWDAIDRMITEGEPEGLYLECKAPSAAKFHQKLMLGRGR